jgi:hypothetical protein
MAYATNKQGYLPNRKWPGGQTIVQLTLPAAAAAAAAAAAKAAGQRSVR